MKLSVIIPFYNADKWIGSCLDSLLDQDINHDEYEIIIIDDGSTESINVLKEYVGRYDSIHYYYQPHSRVGAARNQGISVAKGEYLFFCDADDYVQTRTFGRLLEIAVNEQLDALFFDMLSVRRGDCPFEFHNDFNDVIFYDTGIDYLVSPPHPISFSSCQCIIRGSVLNKLSLSFPEGMMMAEDRFFVVNMLQKIGKVGHVDSVVYYYVQNHESLTHYWGKKIRAGEYANNLYQFVGFLSDLIDNHEIIEKVRSVLIHWRQDDVFTLLNNVFRYCPVSESKDYIGRLKGIGAYPFPERGLGGRIGIVEKVMMKERLWLLACQLFHVLPQKVRYRF